MQGTLSERDGRSGTVDPLALTSLEGYYLVLYKASYLNEEVRCTEPSPSERVPGYGDIIKQKLVAVRVELLETCEKGPML